MSTSECPICFDNFPSSSIVTHAAYCSGERKDKKEKEDGGMEPEQEQGVEQPQPKSPWSGFKRKRKHAYGNKDKDNGNGKKEEPAEKKSPWQGFKRKREEEEEKPGTSGSGAAERTAKPVASVPLAEMMRPACLDDYLGQESVVGEGSMWRSLIERDSVPSIILWGPPGCGKTSLANIIAQRAKADKTIRFVKMSACTSGISDVK
jgi:hypothetical protein